MAAIELRPVTSDEIFAQEFAFGCFIFPKEVIHELP